jgi:hypothetical protein
MFVNYSNIKWSVLGFAVVLLAACASDAPAETAGAESFAVASLQDEQLVPKNGGDPCRGSGRVSARCDIQYNSRCSAEFSAELNCQF